MNRLRLVWSKALLVASLCASWATAYAQTAAVQLDAPAKPRLTYPAPLDMASGLAATLTVQEVAALPRDRFSPFDLKATHFISNDQPLWLRLQVRPGNATAANWQLSIPTVVVDRYEVYQRDASGMWQMAVAGDRVAHTLWPENSLRPRFPLLVSGGGEQDVFIRVVHLLPAKISPSIVNIEAATQGDQTQMLLMGVLVGLFVTLLLICLQMAIAYRDQTYLWYAGYLFCTMLTAVAYSGLGQLVVWPQATKFASDALVYFVLASFAFNLQFVSAMFGRHFGKSHRWMTKGLISACSVYALHASLNAEYANTITILMLILGISCTFIVGTAALAWRRKVAYSGYWLLIYAPFLLSIMLSSVENAGQISLPWLPAHLPLMTIMVEAIAMMLCLNAFSRETHAQAVREQAAAQRDPLTGFLNESRFIALAARAWQHASRSGRDVSLAYVLVEPKGKDLNVVQAEAMMLRSVRMVRIAMSESDGVGRIGKNTLGIAMPNVPPGDALTARLSRLVALGLMLDPHDSAAQALKFTLAVSSWRVNPQEFNSIDKQLRSLLQKDSEERPRTIRFLEPAL